MEKPDNWRKYITWWNDNFDDQIGLGDRKLYSEISTHVLYTFDHSDEFMTLVHQLRNYEAEYRRSYGYDLLMKKPEEIKLVPKAWENFISKVWRNNVVQNTN